MLNRVLTIKVKPIQHFGYLLCFAFRHAALYPDLLCARSHMVRQHADVKLNKNCNCGMQLNARLTVCTYYCYSLFS